MLHKQVNGRVNYLGDVNIAIDDTSLGKKYKNHSCNNVSIYHRDSHQEFAKVGGIFPILHVVFLLDASH